MIAVRIPRTAPGHEKSPIAGALPIVWRRRRDSRVACGDLTREGASRPARARPPHTDVNAALRSWASPRSTRNAPLGRCDLAVRIPCTAPRHEKSPIAGALPIVWRRRRDSNPRTPEGVNGFRDRRIQPLCHPSVWVTRRPEGRRGTIWRRVWDLNPGYAFGVYTISNRAPSATRTTLREIA